MKIITSGAAQETAKEVFQHNKIINQGDKFEVFEVPENIRPLRAYALLLFKETYDFGKGEAPKGTMIIPVYIENRHGYFIGRTKALEYSL